MDITKELGGMVTSIVSKFMDENSPLGKPMINNPVINKEDLEQEAWAAALEALERWEDRGTAKFSSYAYTTIIGKLLNYIRDNASQDYLDIWDSYELNDEEEVQLESTLISPVDDPSYLAGIEEQMGHLIVAFESIDDEIAQLLYANLAFDVPLRELAEASGIPRQTLNYRINKALNTLRFAYYEEQGKRSKTNGGIPSDRGEY